MKHSIVQNYFLYRHWYFFNFQDKQTNWTLCWIYHWTFKLNKENDMVKFQMSIHT